MIWDNDKSEAVFQSDQLTIMVLKEGLLTKRAQGKSGVLGRTNWKDRVFVLTHLELRYFACKAPWNTSCSCVLKGTIAVRDMKSVTTVEKVGHSLFVYPLRHRLRYTLLILTSVKSCISGFLLFRTFLKGGNMCSRSSTLEVAAITNCSLKRKIKGYSVRG